MSMTDLINEQTALVEESNSILKLLGDKTGLYVWKKSIKQTISIKQLTLSETPTVFQVTSDDIDVSTLENLDGFSGTLSGASETTYSFNETHMFWDANSYAYTYDASTGQLSAQMGAATERIFSDSAKYLFVENVVSNDESAYPDGGIQDGFWYEITNDVKDLLSQIGATKFAVDTFTLSADAYNTNIIHSLGVKPKFAILRAAKKNYSNTSSIYIQSGVFNSIHAKDYYGCSVSGFNSSGTEWMWKYGLKQSQFMDATDTHFQWYGYDSSNSGMYVYLAAGVEYTLITFGGGLTDDESGEAPTMISFTIEGTSYQAEEGMTWGEWVDSEYNTGGFTIDSSGNVVGSYIFVDSSYTLQQSSITIKANEAYVYA